MHRASDSHACRIGTTARLRWWTAMAPICLVGILAAGCADKEPPPNPPCERECQDAVALRAIREMMKFAFNMTFQAKPVGKHDLTTERFASGKARVHGCAEANGEQGVTEVNLTYVFTWALYPKKNDEPKENYVIGLEGTIKQKGKIAVQPSAPTALKMQSKWVRVAGTVYDPPIRYVAMPDDDAGAFDDDAGAPDDDGGAPDDDGCATDDDAGTPADDAGIPDDDAGTPADDAGVPSCALEVVQNGNSVSGLFCGRFVGFSF